MRAARRAAGAGLEQKIQGRGVAVERRVRSSAQAAPARVVPARVQREDVLVEAHEHVRRGWEHVRLAETGAEAVVGRLRLEDTHRRTLAELGQMAAQLQLRCDAGSRERRRSEQRQSEDEAEDHHQLAHRSRL